MMGGPLAGTPSTNPVIVGIPSTMQQLGLSFNAYNPIWMVTEPGAFLMSLTSEVVAYSHVLAAFMGYDTAQVALAAREDVLEDWYNNGLGRWVEAVGHDTVPFWEGFVNQVTYTSGTRTLTRGPLLDVTNRVKLKFTTVRYNTNPPIGGVPRSTAWAADADSIARYSQLEEVLSGGELHDTEAEQARDSHLMARKLPKDSEAIQLGGGSVTPAVQLDLLGVGHLLRRYTYNSDVVVTGTYTLPEKLKAVLAAHPSSIFSADYTYVEANSLTVPKFDRDDRLALDVVSSILARGDSLDNRWLFGFRQGRRAYYRAAPASSEVEYEHHFRDNRQVVYTPAGVLVYPWHVKPGVWVRSPDRTKNLVFIESVQYSAPWSLDITKGDANPIKQKLSRLLGTGGEHGG